jgi:hypothetical protein
VPQQTTKTLSTMAVVDDLAVADTSTSAHAWRQRRRGSAATRGEDAARVRGWEHARRAGARRALRRVARARTGLEQRSARRGCERRVCFVKPYR